MGKDSLKLKIKKNKKIIRKQFLLILLFLKNILLIKSLKLKSLSVYDRVVIQDNEIEILWNVKGCHKVKINGVGSFVGNIHGIKFLFSNRYNPLEITFYGIAKKIKKRILIENTKINILKSFRANTSIPLLIQVPYNNTVLQTAFSNGLALIDQPLLILKEPIISNKFKNSIIEFEPYAIKNYN